MESKSPVQQKTNVDILKTMLAAPSVAEQFQNALKEASSTFVASVIDLYNGDNALKQCEPKAVVMEALKAAVLKLPINKSLGFAYIVPFSNSKKDEQGQWTKTMQPTFMLGYKGYIQLAMRTGQYKTINADVVYEGELKTRDKLTGEIDFSGEKTSENVIGYFAHIILLNGFSKTLYMDKIKVDSHAKKHSKSYAQTNGAWKTNFDEMALKTVLRNLLSHYGFLSVEMMGAIDSDSDNVTQERDNQIEDANTKPINIQDISYEEVGNASKEPGF
jgi:recombination protein RecT